MKKYFYCYDIDIDVEPSDFTEEDVKECFKIIRDDYENEEEYDKAVEKAIAEAKKPYSTRCVNIEYERGDDIVGAILDTLTEETGYCINAFKYVPLNKWVQKGNLIIDTDCNITVRDPGYDNSPWCSANLPVSAGKYKCMVKFTVAEGSLRVAEIQIKKVGASGHLSLLDYIPVNAGLAGFFVNKPNFPDNEWMQLCNHIGADRENKAWLFPFDKTPYENSLGFFSESGCGDGEYPVYAHFDKNGKANTIRIKFI